VLAALQPVANASLATDQIQSDDGYLQDKKVRTSVVTASALAFFNLIDHIKSLLSSIDPSNLIEKFKGVMASDIHGIKLFDDEIDIFSKLNSPVLLLSYRSTWSDHSIAKVLVSSCDEAVKLLDEFDSRLELNLSQSISFFPIPPFSSDMIPLDNSTHTILAIRYDQELYKCTLQCVFDVRSLMVEKFEITQHCLQLLAVRNDPTIFYWTIPKCVVSFVSSKVQEHSECFYLHGILEILVHSEPLPLTSDDAKIGSLIFEVESKSDLEKREVCNLVFNFCFANIKTHGSLLYDPKNYGLHNQHKSTTMYNAQSSANL